MEPTSWAYFHSAPPLLAHPATTPCHYTQYVRDGVVWAAEQQHARGAAVLPVKRSNLAETNNKKAVLVWAEQHNSKGKPLWFADQHRHTWTGAQVGCIWTHCAVWHEAKHALGGEGHNVAAEAQHATQPLMAQQPQPRQFSSRVGMQHKRIHGRNAPHRFWG